MEDSKKPSTKQEAPDRTKILEEVKRLAQKAQETAEGKQFALFEGENLDEDGFDSSVLNDTVNPDLSHRLYYGFQRLLRDNLPADKKLRRYVNDEKLLFLNQGKRIKPSGVRGSDSRMAPPETLLREAFDVIANWVRSGADAYDLFLAFRERNEALGYYDKKEALTDPDSGINSFDTLLGGILAVGSHKEGKNEKPPE